MSLKIGLFDSGVGGLTCLGPLIKKFPSSHFVYLGDTARLPYGTKSKETISHYALQNISFLKQHQVDLIVSACHSASTALIGHDSSDGTPIFEVISPACGSIVSEVKTVGLMATAATVASGAYDNALAKRHPHLKVFSQPCPLLVPLVETGWVDDPITNSVIKRYLAPLLAKAPEVLILGCTHFPVLKEAIQKLVPTGTYLLDPGEALARHIELKYGTRYKLSTTITHRTDTAPALDFFLTDRSPHFVELARRLLPEGLRGVEPQLCSLNLRTK